MVPGKDDDVADNDEPSVQDGMHLSLEDCWFQNNYITSFTESYAAAMLLWKLNITITRVQILDHLVPKALGTVIMLMCKAVIDHSDFKNNSVAHGGAFYINQHSLFGTAFSGELGGALFFWYGKFHGHSMHAIFVSMHAFLGDFLQHFPVAFGRAESATQRVDQHWQVSRRIARCSRRCRQGPTQPMGSDECHIGWFVPCSYRLLALVVSVCNH